MLASTPERIHRYRILSEIGRGAMGRVYLAEDPNVGRRVALKVLAPRRLAAPSREAGLRRRFLHEVRAAGRLHHPGIVAVFDAGTDPASGSPFLAMEWVAGRTLRQVLDAGPLSPLAASSLAAQVARALEHAHRRGVIHRDVKPTNLLVTDDRRVKLADFGIARLVRSRTVTAHGVVFGTPCYMAPEQIRGAPVDGRCDLFALGAVLYECVTGRRAFGADSPEAVRRRVLAAAPPAPETLCPGVPPNLGRVIGRALEKRPDDRFQTGADFAAALDRVAAELAANASGPPRPVSLDARGAPGGGRQEETVRLDAETEVIAGGPAEAGVRARRRRAATAVLGLTVLLAIWIRDLEPARDPGPRPPTAPAVVADRQPALRYPPTPPPPPASAPRQAAATGIRPPASTAAVANPEIVAAEWPPGRIAFCPAPAATPGDPPAAAAASTATSTLEIVHRSRLRRALLSVWIDGERVLVEGLNGKLLARLFGQRLRREIEVPPGEHAVEVQVADLSRELEARRSIAGQFTAGEQKRLRVQLRREGNELELRWGETKKQPVAGGLREAVVSLDRPLPGLDPGFPGAWTLATQLAGPAAFGGPTDPAGLRAAGR